MVSGDQNDSSGQTLIDYHGENLQVVRNICDHWVKEMDKLFARHHSSLSIIDPTQPEIITTAVPIKPEGRAPPTRQQQQQRQHPAHSTLK